MRISCSYLFCLIAAAAATFSRFIPSIKARFDYGAMIFILTFTLVSVSGYRVEKLLELAHHRLFTIAIGTSICIITAMLVWPVWAGTELHNLIKNNMDKLSDSLECCVAEYFRNDVKASNKTLQGYKCALNSKATEESLVSFLLSLSLLKTSTIKNRVDKYTVFLLQANFARWEPAHGGFNFGHPWKEYVKIGASLRSCAYCIEALNGTISSDSQVINHSGNRQLYLSYTVHSLKFCVFLQAPDLLKEHFSNLCITLSVKSSAVLKQLVVSITTMQKSSRIDFMVEEMRSAVEDLQNALKSLSKQSTGDLITSTTVVEIVPLVTISSLLIEIAARTEKIAEAVEGLAEKAEFKVESAEEMKKSQSSKAVRESDEEDKTVMILQRV